MTDTHQLKLCPFCGGIPYLANVEMAGCSYVVCTDCRMQSDDGSQDRVINSWNTRTPPIVKPLVWDTARGGNLFCLTTVADYTIREDEDGFPELEIKSCDAEEWETHQDVCVAKAAAHADYTYRILEALE